MTDEELDQARVVEARRRWHMQPTSTPGVSQIAAPLAREGWMPTESVNPLLVIARRAVGAELRSYGDHKYAERIEAGKFDGHLIVQCAFLALQMQAEAKS